MSKSNAANPKPLNWEVALDLILDAFPIGDAWDAPIQQAHGMICAKDVVSAIAVPPFDNSSMDGFAVRSHDVAAAGDGTPVTLRVIGEAPAGKPFFGEMGEGEAVAIMTGAPLPSGADAVVRVEDTTRPSTELVEIRVAVKPGTAVRRAGADTAAGELVAKRGDVMSAGRIALAASCGIAQVNVVKPPTIALAVGGDEVVAVKAGVALLPGEIFDSNGPMLIALFQSWGFDVEFLGRMPDDPRAMLDFLRRGQQFDVLVTVGGVSMGEHDYMRPCLAELGANELFWKINQQPGGPMLFALLESTRLFGLPGNPVSSYVCADIYVQAALRKSCGFTQFRPARIQATLTEPLKKPHRKVAFVRCCLSYANGAFTAQSTGAQDSNRIRSIAWHDGYILFPEEKNELAAGDAVDVLITDAAALGRVVAR